MFVSYTHIIFNVLTMPTSDLVDALDDVAGIDLNSPYGYFVLFLDMVNWSSYNSYNSLLLGIM